MSQSREKLTQDSLIKLQTHNVDFNSPPIKGQFHGIFNPSIYFYWWINIPKIYSTYEIQMCQKCWSQVWHIVIVTRMTSPPSVDNLKPPCGQSKGSPILWHRHKTAFKTSWKTKMKFTYWLKDVLRINFDLQSDSSYCKTLLDCHVLSCLFICLCNRHCHCHCL